MKSNIKTLITVLLAFIAMCLTITLTSCVKPYDDTELKNQLASQQEQIDSQNKEITELKAKFEKIEAELKDNIDELSTQLMEYLDEVSKDNVEYFNKLVSAVDDFMIKYEEYTKLNDERSKELEDKVSNLSKELLEVCSEMIESATTYHFETEKGSYDLSYTDTINMLVTTITELNKMNNASYKELKSDMNGLIDKLTTRVKDLEDWSDSLYSGSRPFSQHSILEIRDELTAINNVLDIIKDGLNYKNPEGESWTGSITTIDQLRVYITQCMLDLTANLRDYKLKQLADKLLTLDEFLNESKFVTKYNSSYKDYVVNELGATYYASNYLNYCDYGDTGSVGIGPFGGPEYNKGEGSVFVIIPLEHEYEDSNGRKNKVGKNASAVIAMKGEYIQGGFLNIEVTDKDIVSEYKSKFDGCGTYEKACYIYTVYIN